MTSIISQTYTEHRTHLNYFSTADGKVAYIDKGEGPCILLLHGIPTSSWLYRKMYMVLVQEGNRVIVPDMLGYGSSDKPMGYEMYSAKNAGKRILELMSHLGIESWSQVFHDGGGLWTWEMLQQDDSKVNHLIMLNTIVYQSGFKPPMKFGKGWIAKFYARLYSSKIGQKLVINGTFKNGLADRSFINKNMLDGYKIPLIGYGHYAMYYFFTQTCHLLEDYNALHRSLHIPLTVIWGKEDNILVFEHMRDEIKSNFNIEDKSIHLFECENILFRKNLRMKWFLKFYHLLESR